MNYYVFNITDKSVRDETINEKKAKNLEKIILSILGFNGNGLPGEIQHFKIQNDIELHKISIYRKKYLGSPQIDSDLEIFVTDLANDLLNAELIKEKDGTRRRNKRITSGILIIKHETNKLTLLKLEETSSIDISTYELKSAFMTDRRYYKAAVITNNSINVIDKNRKVANYWAHDFLQLQRERDDRENTKYLISQITTDGLLAKEIADKVLRKTINNLIREKLFTEPRFEPDEWLEEVNNTIKGEGISFQANEDLFSKNILDSLDESFVINKKVVKSEFNTIIEVSSGIKIEANNIDIAIEKQDIIFENGYLKILVPQENIRGISELFNKSVVTK